MDPKRNRFHAAETLALNSDVVPNTLALDSAATTLPLDSAMVLNPPV